VHPNAPDRGVAPSPAPGEVGHAVQLVIDAIHESGENNGAPKLVDPKKGDHRHSPNSPVRRLCPDVGPMGASF